MSGIQSKFKLRKGPIRTELPPAEERLANGKPVPPTAVSAELPPTDDASLWRACAAPGASVEQVADHAGLPVADVQAALERAVKRLPAKSTEVERRMQLSQLDFLDAWLINALVSRPHTKFFQDAPIRDPQTGGWVRCLSDELSIIRSLIDVAKTRAAITGVRVSSVIVAPAVVDIDPAVRASIDSALAIANASRGGRPRADGSEDLSLGTVSG
jgi:hypothetical protein